MTRKICVGAVLLLGMSVFSQVSLAQEQAVSGLRIADEAGNSVGEVPAPPGEKHFHLDSGVQKIYIAFDFSGTQATDVQVKFLGVMGTILFLDTQTYDTPGTKVVGFDSSLPLEDMEYVVNAYIGPELYLADSLQLAVGEAQIPPAREEEVDAQGAPVPEAYQATVVPVRPADVEGPRDMDSPADVPGGPPQWMLLLAGLGVLVLFAVVVWAARSALRSS